jgi:hypothetical protein
MSSALSRSAIVDEFNRGFFVFVLVDCRIKSTGTLAYRKASFGLALELSRSPRPRVIRQHGCRGEDGVCLGGLAQARALLRRQKKLFLINR